MGSSKYSNAEVSSAEIIVCELQRFVVAACALVMTAFASGCDDGPGPIGPVRYDVIPAGSTISEIMVPDARGDITPNSKPFSIPAVHSSRPLTRGSNVAFEGGYEPALPDEPPRVAVVRFCVDMPDGQQAIANEGNAVAERNADGKFRYRVLLKTPAKPGSYHVEVRYANRIIAGGEIEVD